MTICDNVTNSNVLDDFFDAAVAYGKCSTVNEIAYFNSIYPSVVAGSTAAGRIEVRAALTRLIIAREINANPLLAMAICDPAPEVASTAALDFVCYCPLDADGKPCGIIEFAGLFPSNTLANPGAVFGGLLALGDYTLSGFYRETVQFLTPGDLRTASHACRSGRLFDTTIDFWIELLELLIEKTDNDSLEIVGIAGATVAAFRSSANSPEIWRVNRVYPATAVECPVLIAGSWSIVEYTQLIATRLRTIAEREPPPCIMPEVLNAWEIGYKHH